MKTELTPAEFGALLMPVAAFPYRKGMEPERTLVLRGRLTPVTVGRTRYYLRSDVEALTGGGSR